jgi:hypothetical protein
LATGLLERLKTKASQVSGNVVKKRMQAAENYWISRVIGFQRGSS